MLKFHPFFFQIIISQNCAHKKHNNIIKIIIRNGWLVVVNGKDPFETDGKDNFTAWLLVDELRVSSGAQFISLSCFRKIMWSSARFSNLLFFIFRFKKWQCRNFHYLPLLNEIVAHFAFEYHLNIVWRWSLW